MKGIVPWLFGVVMGFVLGISMGKQAGYDQALKEIKAVVPTPVIKTTDEQCVAWMLETNLRDVKKRICR